MFELVDDSYQRNLAIGRRIVLLFRLLFVAGVIFILGISAPQDGDIPDEAQVFYSEHSLIADFFFLALDNGHIFDAPQVEETPPPKKAKPAKEIAVTKTAITPPRNSTKFSKSSVSKVKNAPDKVRKFIGRWCVTAKQEEKRTGIPSSVKLAQGAIESAWGTSKLTEDSNNYFGIKCHEKSHKKYGLFAAHCVQRHDDHADDRFLRHATPWESWRKHSNLMQNPRYSPCSALATPAEVADCLKAKGYATSKTYAAKVKDIIKKWGLDAFDDMTEDQVKIAQSYLLYGKS